MKEKLFLALCILALLSSCKKNEPSTDEVKDICGNTYPVVAIGTQIWMAENLRCSKYDTRSEAYNAAWLTNNTIQISISEGEGYTPYYIDAADKSKWGSTDHSGNLTDAQIAKLGYLYNWAATVGVEDGKKYSTAFSGNRQGICPNGWHVPSNAEWNTLVNYIESGSSAKEENTVGKHLKTTSGWYNGDKFYKPGLDTYGFAALPSGCSGGNTVSGVGFGAYFWSATPNESKSNSAYQRYFFYHGDNLYDNGSLMYYRRSVRCLKD